MSQFSFTPTQRIRPPINSITLCLIKQTVERYVSPVASFSNMSLIRLCHSMVFIAPLVHYYLCKI